MLKPGLQNKRRLLGILLVFSGLFALLVLRLAWVQIINGDWLLQKAFEQQNRDREITPKRGTISDRNGKVLAVSASVEKVVVSPQEIKKSKKDLNMIARQLSETLQLPLNSVLDKITKNSRYELIKRWVEKDAADKIRAWRQEQSIPGVYIDEDVKRYYPNRNLAAHVIGFTGYDNQGLDGIEKMADTYLKGQPGKILSEVDAGGREIPFNDEKRINPQDGLGVVLTIDETIQHFAQKAIEKAIDDNKVASGACAVVMDPRNGEILALVSKPDFDPNDPRAVPPGIDPATWKGNTAEDIKTLTSTVWRDKAITDTYEPGSTFKAFTSAAGLEENAVTPDSTVSDATATVQGWNINCWKPNAHGVETFTEGVYNSCNPVFVRIALSLGIDKFYQYVKAFGFYDKTGITLPGEASSIIHRKPAEIDMASASFGQRFQITPIQLITGYGAIANGGKLLKPHIIKELTDSGGNVVKRYEPEVMRTVISKKTDDTLRNILEGVVTLGTGRNAYVKGYRVAGKTGTSETTETKKNGRYIASFCAFAPADNPVICALVILDNPKGEAYYGGTIAAPVAGKIVEDTLNYLQVERRYSESDKEYMPQNMFVPDARKKTVTEAKKIISTAGLSYIIEGTGDTVVEQTPKPSASVAEKAVVILYTYKPNEEVMVTVPSLATMSVAQATQTLSNLGLNITTSGVGQVANQLPKPGQKLPKGGTVTVDFRVTSVD